MKPSVTARAARRPSGAAAHDAALERPRLVSNRDDAGGAAQTAVGLGGRLAALERRARAATHDDATGLPNGALFFDRLRQAIARTRGGGETFAVAIVAVAIVPAGSFDPAGASEAGRPTDAMLRSTADRLRRCVSGGDTVARLGSDVFGLLLPGADEARVAEKALQRMLRTCDGGCESGSRQAMPTIKIGGAVCPDDGEDVAALMRAADRSLDRARQSAGSALAMGTGADAGDAASLRRELLPITDGGDASLGILLDGVPIQRRVIHSGDAVFRAGDPFTRVHILRCGVCKLVSLGADGHEQLVSLVLKGDWLGLDGIARGEYAYDAISVDTGEIWSFRYDALLRRCALSPALIDLLHVAMSRAIGREAMAQGKLGADAKVAQFLHQLAEGLTQRGLRSDRITLHVTRAEIGSHLGLRLETVSRAISRLAHENLIGFGRHSRRELLIPRLAALREYVRDNAARGTPG